MEQIDATVLKIIFSVLGFVIVSLGGIIAYLFKGLSRDTKTVAENQSLMRIDLVTIKGDLSTVKDSLYRELDMIKDDIGQTLDRTNQNSARITDMNKELGAISEWKKITSK